MSSGKDHAPHPTIRSIAGDVIQNDFRAVDTETVTAGFYPHCGLYAALFCFPVPLKHKLQGELKNSWIQGRVYLAECARAEARPGGGEGTGPHTVQDIECFASELDLAAFPNVERSRNRHIELPRARAKNGVVPGISIRPDIGQSKRGRIDPVLNSLITVDTLQNLIRSLYARIDSTQGAVHAG